MIKEIKENMVRIVILDISSVYIQIYDQGYFNERSVEDIKLQYSDEEHWQVLVFE